MAILGSRALAGVLAMSVAGWTAVALRAQTTVFAEDSIKAAFLFNFAKYVEWPERALAPDTFRICIAADPAFVKTMDEIVAGETIKGRPVQRKAPISADETDECNILYVGRGAAERTGDLLATSSGAHVLTVGDTADFLTRGGMVKFVRNGDRIRFDVNLDEAQRSGLTISSRLLRVARQVVAAGGRP